MAGESPRAENGEREGWRANAGAGANAPADGREPECRAPVVILETTYPDEDSALKAARELLEAKAAACVSLGPAHRSLYLEEGKIADEREVTLRAKTAAHRADAAAAIILRSHPYRIPQLLRLGADASDRYLDWMRQELRG